MQGRATGAVNKMVVLSHTHQDLAVGEAGHADAPLARPDQHVEAGQAVHEDLVLHQIVGGHPEILGKRLDRLGNKGESEGPRICGGGC